MKITHLITLFFIAYALIYLLSGNTFSETELIVLFSAMGIIQGLSYFFLSPRPTENDPCKEYRRHLECLSEREFKNEKDTLFEMEDKKLSKKFYSIYMDIEAARQHAKKTQL